MQFTGFPFDSEFSGCYLCRPCCQGPEQSPRCTCRRSSPHGSSIDRGHRPSCPDTRQYLHTNQISYNKTLRSGARFYEGYFDHECQKMLDNSATLRWITQPFTHILYHFHSKAPTNALQQPPVSLRLPQGCVKLACDPEL